MGISRQKKDIIINGLISTIPGFLTGGIGGIFSVLFATGLLAHVEQITDDEIKERQKLNNIKHKQEVRKAIASKEAVLSEIKQLWKNEKRFGYRYGNIEMERDLNRILPGEVVKGKVILSHFPDGIFSFSSAPHIVIEAEAYNEFEFLQKLKDDYNKKIEMYDLVGIWGNHRFTYGYMLAGKMILCW